MAIIRFGDRPFYRNPWIEFERVRREMDELARGLMGGGDGRENPTVYPALSITEDENAIYIEAEVAGVAPDAIEISLEGDTLTLKGERTPAQLQEKVSYHRREVEYGKFNRAVSLPTRIDAEKVEAQSVNGILCITLPKAEDVKPRQIKVSR